MAEGAWPTDLDRGSNMWIETAIDGKEKTVCVVVVLDIGGSRHWGGAEAMGAYCT